MVTVVIEVGVCWLVVLHAVKQQSKVSRALPAISLRSRRRFLVAKQSSPKHAGSKARYPAWSLPKGASIAPVLAPVVAMVSVLVAAVPPLGVTEAGLKLQVASAGRPLQENVTAELKLPTDPTDTI